MYDIAGAIRPVREMAPAVSEEIDRAERENPNTFPPISTPITTNARGYGGLPRVLTLYLPGRPRQRNAQTGDRSPNLDELAFTPLDFGRNVRRCGTTAQRGRVANGP